MNLKQKCASASTGMLALAASFTPLLCGGIGDGGFLDSSAAGMATVVDAIVKWADITVLVVALLGTAILLLFYSNNQKAVETYKTAFKIIFVAAIIMNGVYGLSKSILWMADHLV